MIADRKEASRSSRAIKGVFWSTLNSLLPTAIGFFVFLVVSRFVGPAEYGAVALATSLAALAGILVPAGFAEAIVQKLQIDDVHFDSVFWAVLVCAATAYILLVSGATLAGHILKSEVVPALVPLVGLRVIFDALGLVPNAIIARKMLFELVVLRTLLATLSSAAITIVLLLAGYDIWALAIAQVSSSAVAAVAAMLGARWSPGLRFSRAAVSSLARYAAFSSGTRAIQALTTQADPAIVGLAVGPSQAGIYAFARNVFQMIVGVVATPLGTVAHPMFSSIQEQKDKVRSGFLMATFLSALVSFPLFIGFAVVADLAIPLVFGPRWMDAVLPIRLFCGLGLMSCIGVIQASLINSRGEADWWFYYQLIAGGLTVVILFFGAKFGVSAAVAGLLFATMARWPFAVLKSCRLLAMKASDYIASFVAPAVGCIFMVGAIFLEKTMLSEASPILQLLTHVAVGGAAYFIAVSVLAKRRLLDLASILRGIVRPSAAFDKDFESRDR